jgi:hypothetical protein
MMWDILIQIPFGTGYIFSHTPLDVKFRAYVE